MGGEPFDQPDALRQLITFIHLNSSVSVFVYTGYSYKAIASIVDDMPYKMDALMTEPFISGDSQSQPLRGSDNQQLHCLTKRGVTEFSSLKDKSILPTLDISHIDDTSFMAGVPKKRFLHLLKEEAASKGHYIKHTEAKPNAHD